MNPIQNEIIEHVSSFSKELTPLGDECRKYAKFCSSIHKEESWNIAHRPWIAPENYLITLFVPAKKSWFSKYKQLHNIDIPKVIQNVLIQTNGFFAFGMSFYGMPPTMLKSDPGLDRSRLNIGTANRRWKLGYNIDQSLFHFAARHYTDSENIGYFLDKNSNIYSFRKTGEQLGMWSDLSSFLASEIKASEELECIGETFAWLH